VYENLGINYARLKDLGKAEEYLFKAAENIQEDNGYLLCGSAIFTLLIIDTSKPSTVSQCARAWTVWISEVASAGEICGRTDKPTGNRD